MEYRVTKYNPSKRDSNGIYLDMDEWTSIRDVGKSVTLKDYENTEKAYIETAIELLKESGCSGLYITAAEEITESPLPNRKGDFIELDNIGSLFRSALREEVGYRFDNNEYFVVFGYDYYMYVGVTKSCPNAMRNALLKNIYVEEFTCPYNEKEC